jgi:hypothetical protein
MTPPIFLGVVLPVQLAAASRCEMMFAHSALFHYDTDTSVTGHRSRMLIGTHDAAAGNPGGDRRPPSIVRAQHGVDIEPHGPRAARRFRHLHASGADAHVQRS